MPKIIKGFKITDSRQGGMAVVYKGEKQGGFTRAFKVVRPDKAENNPKLTILFHKGIEVLQRLDHPNIIKALDAYSYTDDVDGAVYTVLEMDWLNGLDLENYVKKHAPKGLDVNTMKIIALRIAEGMLYAHTKNILHLDIKPSNIFRTHDGYIKIIDFGISKIIGENADIVKDGDSISITSTESGESTFKGTLAYSSPEQQVGARLTERSDIYSYGKTLRFLLTGEIGPTAEVSDPLFAPIVQKCIQENPNHRYQSFKDVITALKMEQGAKEGERKRCVNNACGKMIPSTSMFCQHCGTKQEKKDKPTKKTCPTCKAVISSESRFCDQCGYDFNRRRKEQDWYTCSNCGKTVKIIDSKTRFCYYCGNKN